eukprot:3031955-Pleurochrysis_carterae.AAC.5
MECSERKGAGRAERIERANYRGRKHRDSEGLRGSPRERHWKSWRTDDSVTAEKQIKTKATRAPSGCLHLPRQGEDWLQSPPKAQRVEKGQAANLKCLTCSCEEASNPHPRTWQIGTL